MRKKVAIIVLALAMAGSLTACNAISSLIGNAGSEEASLVSTGNVDENSEKESESEPDASEPELPSEEEKIVKEYTLDKMLTGFSGGIAWAKVHDDSGMIMEVLLNQDLQIVYEKPDDMVIGRLYGGRAILTYQNGEEMNFIVLDANGEKVFEATGFDGTPSFASDGSLVYVTRESDISTNKLYVNVINANYEQVCKIETDNGIYLEDWYYVADGVYANSYGILNVNQNTYLNCGSAKGLCFDGDGCVFFDDGYFYINADLIDWNSITSEDALENIIRTNGQDFYSGRYIGNHTIYYNKDALFEGRNFPDYILKSEDLGCAFSENGNMALTVRGADGKDYVVVCDSTGNPLYEPAEVDFHGDSSKILFCQNYIILSDGTVVTPDGSKCQLGDGTALSGLDKECVASLDVYEKYGITRSDDLSLSNGYITNYQGKLYSIDGTQITTVTKVE